MPTKHRATLRTVSQFATAREDFDCNGTLSGRKGYASMYVGQLPREFQADYDGARYAEDFFVVHSYSTPIAWFAKGSWHVPNVKYSPTTSRHLSSLRLGTDWAASKGRQYVTLR